MRRPAVCLLLLTIMSTILSAASSTAARWSVFINPPEPSDWYNRNEIPQTLGKTPAKFLEEQTGVIAFDGETPTPIIMFREIKAEKAMRVLWDCSGDAPFEIKVNQLSPTMRRLPATANAPSRQQALVHLRQGVNIIVIKLNGRNFSYLQNDADWSQWQKILPTCENFRALREGLIPASEDASRRLGAEAVIQEGTNSLYSDIFKEYDQQADLPADKLKYFHEGWPILGYYDSALDRILASVPKTTPPANGVAVWHLYNMGYVIKTPGATIGIDIHHRRGHLLEPLLDALLITHNHSDHYNKALIQAMLDKGKPVFSNFVESPQYSTEPRGFTVGDISVQTDITDHNPKLVRFMTTYRIACGDEKKGAPVLFHSGDSYNHRQLKPQMPIHVFMVHPRVGLSVPEAALVLNPQSIFFSHLLELGHCKPGRWNPIPFSDAHFDAKRIAKKQPHIQSVRPLWGELFILPPR